MRSNGVGTPNGNDEGHSVNGHLSTNGNGAGPKETDEELTRIVEECTTSITREVAGLKALVDEFSRFARMPAPRLEAGDLNELIRQTASLYGSAGRC